MKRFFALLILVSVFGATALAADRITLTIVLTNAPTDADTITVNATARTWKTNSSAVQITLTNSIGANATNLYNHVAANPFTGPLVLLRSGTNGVQLVGQVGQAVVASISAAYASLTYATQAVQTASVVRVPITIEPVASSRTNIASLLVSNVFNLGLSTNLVLPGSTAMSNFVNTSTAQTVAGVKTFTDYTDLYGANLTNGTLLYVHTNSGINFLEGSALYMQTNVSIFDAAVIDKWRFSSIERTNSITVFSDLTNKINARVTGENSWTGTNTFTRITNSTWVGGTITNATIYGVTGTLTNGYYASPILSNAVHRGVAIQTYTDDSRNVQIGGGAVITNLFVNSVAIGQDAHVGGDESVALGQLALSKHNTAAALGYGATTTADNQVRLGTSAEQVSAPGSAAVGGNFAIGHSDSPTFPTTMAKGLYMTNGTAATANPVNGGAVWSLAGELQYRTSGASEGDGGTKRLHNREVETNGAGNDYAILNTSYNEIDFSTTDPNITLPTAGTYFYIYTVTVDSGAAGSGDLYYAKIYDSTAAADIANSEGHLESPGNNIDMTFKNHGIATVAGSSVFRLYIRNASSGRGIVKSAYTKITAIRLY